MIPTFRLWLEVQVCHEDVLRSLGRKPADLLSYCFVCLGHGEAIAAVQDRVQRSDVRTELFSGEGRMDKILNAIFCLPLPLCLLRRIFYFQGSVVQS